MARTTSTEKAAARSVRPAAGPGGPRLGGVDLETAQDARRYRALADVALLDVAEDGTVRLIAALQPLPTGLCKRLAVLLGTDRRSLARAIDGFVAVQG